MAQFPTESSEIFSYLPKTLTSSVQQLEKMASLCADLPDECWEWIFNRLGHHSHLETLTLVCKRFLSLSNRLRTRFAVVDPTIFIHGNISKLLLRFKHLKSIDFSYYDGDIAPIIIDIARSSLNIETLNLSNQKRLPLEGLGMLGWNNKCLKVLICSNVWIQSDVELRVIGDSLPWLEELDISGPCHIDVPLSAIRVTDSGFEELCSKLANLRRINVSGHHFITDKSLVALSSHCLLLREFTALHCPITYNGVDFIMRHSPNLSDVVISIDFNAIQYSRGSLPITYARALSTLHLYELDISDESLSSLAKAGIPLKSFGLFVCRNFSLSGISFLLYNYHSLENLAIEYLSFLTDQAISDLSPYLQKLKAITLNDCSGLTSSTFFILAKNCTLLEDINMCGANLSQEDCSVDLVKNPRIKSLNISWNSKLNDDCLKRIASVCPRLEELDLGHCSGIAEGGVAQVLKICCEIRHLLIDFCKGIKNIGMGSELPKLEVLEAKMSGINSEGVAMIAERCCGLVKLDLEDCLGVTTGVEEVIRNCTRLREINLKDCFHLNVERIDWMLFSRPSLRKIIPPSSVTEEQKQLFLRHGCQVGEP